MEHGKGGPAAGSQAPGCDVICCDLEPSGGSWVSSIGGQWQGDGSSGVQLAPASRCAALAPGPLGEEVQAP